MAALDLIASLTAIEDRLKRPSSPTRAERRELAESVAAVRSGILRPSPPVDPRAALADAIRAAAQRGIPYQELVTIFNDTVEQRPGGQ